MDTTEETKTVTEAAPDAQDASVPDGETRETQPGTGAVEIPQESHDEAIKEAVKDIHG